jgi:hypothetical protein
MHQGGSGPDRARYPDRRDRIGEDPARWLDAELLTPQAERTKWVQRGRHEEMTTIPDGQVSPRGLMVRARIQGIDKLAVVAHWLHVEHDLERGPREFVVELLEDRAAELKETGERPDRLPHGPHQSYTDWCDGDEPLTDQEIAEIRAERRSSVSSSPRSASSSTSSDATSGSAPSALDDFADVATDGGEP